MTAMRLHCDGRLDIDVPIAEYIPDLRIYKSDLGKSITVRHLLSHTAGFPKEYTPIGPRDESALEASLRKEICDIEPAYTPCLGYLYSNLGYRLASLIMQRATGKPYSALARELILEPLNMSRTTFDLCVAATYPLALPHEIGKDGVARVIHQINENATRLAAGGLYSPTADITKLIRCLINGGKADNGVEVLPESAINEMLTQHALADNDANTGYGLGMLILRPENKILYGHTGSAPPYSSAMLFDPEARRGAVVMVNTSAEKLARRIALNILK